MHLTSGERTYSVLLVCFSFIKTVVYSYLFQKKKKKNILFHLLITTPLSYFFNPNPPRVENAFIPSIHWDPKPHAWRSSRRKFQSTMSNEFAKSTLTMLLGNLRFCRLKMVSSTLTTLSKMQCLAINANWGMSIRKSKTLLSLEASVFEMILIEKLIKQFAKV